MEQLFGPYGTLSPQNADRFRGSEANAVWFHGFSPELFERCESVDAGPCVEFRTFRANFDERPELRPIGVDGSPIRYGRLVQGVCLSRSEFIEERQAELAEGLADYSPRGVWLDYLTYAGWFETPDPDLQESCFCANCVTEFNEATGIDCTEPGEILSRHGEAWHAHKVDRIESFGRRFADIIRTARPDCLVGLYACPWHPEEFDGAITRIFGQDLSRLAEVFDVITPLIYAEKCGRPPGWSADYMRRSREFVPDSAAVMPILDVLDFPQSVTALVDAAGAEQAASRPAGVQIFGGDAIFADAGKTAVFNEAVRRIREAAT